MAQFKGANRTKADTPTSDNVLAPGTLGGRVRVMQDNFTFAGEAAGEIIELFQDLKAGATILDIVIHNADLGTGTLLDIGDSNDVDRYIDGYDADANLTSRGGGTAVTGQFQVAGNQYVIGTNTGDTQIIITTSVAAATGLVTVSLYYTED